MKNKKIYVVVQVSDRESIYDEPKSFNICGVFTSYKKAKRGINEIISSIGAFDIDDDFINTVYYNDLSDHMIEVNKIENVNGKFTTCIALLEFTPNSYLMFGEEVKV